ncbi:MerR family transcriptional regulator [Streptomyces sp. NPDC048636]|uniref:MerR family transcriptional regulator n=1 Tax=Streptomyces sp. NPDC048636 TaxID=3155762 RepID=UPI003444BFEE
MKLSELSERSGIPIATIKFYRRKGLLPPGRTLSATEADYDDAYLRRLNLIRALTRLGGLSVTAVRDILAELDGPSSPARAMGVVDYALSSGAPDVDTDQPDESEGDTRSEGWADSLITAMGWEISPDSPHRHALDRRMRALRHLGLEWDTDELRAYARLAEEAVGLDAARLAGSQDRMAIAERMVILLTLFEPVLSLMRRLAHEDAARRGTTEL